MDEQGACCADTGKVRDRSQLAEEGCLSVCGKATSDGVVGGVRQTPTQMPSLTGRVVDVKVVEDDSGEEVDTGSRVERLGVEPSDVSSDLGIVSIKLTFLRYLC